MLFAECRHAAAYIIGARLEIRRRELYQMRRFAHILFGEAAGGHGGRTEAYAACYKGALRVIRYRIFVCRDIDLVKTMLKLLASDVHRAQVDEHEMIVRAA